MNSNASLGDTYFSAAKGPRCTTANGVPRSSSNRGVIGSKQVINHIQTIIRNNNTSTDANNIFHDMATGPNFVTHTNNFFTTEAVQKPGTHIQSRPQTGNLTGGRLQTAGPTNRVKTSFYSGFQALPPQENLATTAATIQRQHATAIEK